MNMNEENKKGIVLNRMYTGSYLSTNLGHEVINMFQADNRNHYLYLNARGNFSERGEQVGIMLLVRGINDNRVEVVGMAKNLNYVESANCTLSRDLGRRNEKVRKEQETFLTSKDHKVEYGKVPIIEIFGDKGQQSVYVSYWVEEGQFFKPCENKRIIIEFPPSKKNGLDNKIDKDVDVTEMKEDSDENLIVKRLKQHNFSSQSLHQFILEGVDWESLSNLCNDNDLWVEDNTKVDSQANVEKQEISLFDICQIQKDENRISNALSYFIDKYPELWRQFFSYVLKTELDEIESVTREENAKVEGDKSTGGRIDLLIRTKNYYIILENKIDSDIIIENGLTQLERYYNYVTILQDQEIDRLEAEKKFLEQDLGKYTKYYNDPNRKHWKKKSTWKQKITELTQKLNKVEQELNDVKSRKIAGFVLTPNYNPPDKKDLKVKNSDFDFDFGWLPYRTIYDWLNEEDVKCVVEEDADFKAFYNVIKRHKYEFESSMLYEDMKSTFFTRIKEIRSKKVNNA